MVIDNALRDRYIVGIARADSVVPSNYHEVVVVHPSKEAVYAADQVLSLQRRDNDCWMTFRFIRETSLMMSTICMPSRSEFLAAKSDVFSLTETEQRREKTLAAIPREKLIIKAGQRMVARNEPITGLTSNG